MPVKEILGPNRAVFTCPECGKEFEADYTDPAEGFATEIMKLAYDKAICSACHERKDRQRAAEEELRKKQELLFSLGERMKLAGFPELFRNMEKPFIRDTAVWMWKNRSEHLLGSGETGTGKTSSAAFVIREMMKAKELNVLYRTWQMLQAEFVKAKTEDGDNEYRFFRRIDELDYLIVDELIGKKGEAKFSPSGQDLLFNLIDGAYSKSRKTKIWIFGNFYEGSIDRILDDPMPTRRRLQQSFKPAWFETGKPIDETLRIYGGTQ